MVSLAQLGNELGSSLKAVVAGPEPGAQLTGVHVSELADPTTYLEGGELLLTTGIPLGGSPATAAAYVRRLSNKRVAALGLGLGEGLDSVPEWLKEACAQTQLSLFEIPEGVPFLDVSRAFWTLAARSGQADLISSLGTQTALARAVMRPDALMSVVKGLAGALVGWAAFLPADGSEATLWPASTEVLLPNLRDETVRLNREGVHSAATFWLQGSPVVEYPILVGRRIDGFLAIGPGRTLTKADRQVIMTVCVLLALKSQQRSELSSTATALGAAVAKLLVLGYVDAARLLAADIGVGSLPERVRLLGVRNSHESASPVTVPVILGLQSDEDTAALPGALADCRLRYSEGGLDYLLLDADNSESLTNSAATAHGGLLDAASLDSQAQNSAGVQGDPALNVGAAWTVPLSLAQVAGAVAALRRAAALAPAGRLVGGLSGDEESTADQWAIMLASYARVDLIGTVTAYLRHRGHWEETARELGVHRNSLRHRMSVAETLLDVKFEDPDTAAQLWLALRRRGL